MTNIREKLVGLMNPRGAAFAMAALCFVGWMADYATDRAGAAFAPPAVVPDTPVPVSVPRGGDARREILFDPYAPLFATKGPLRLSVANGSIPDVNYGEGYAAVDGSVNGSVPGIPRGPRKSSDDGLRYIGRISGTAPIAVLQDGDQRRIVSVGDSFNNVVVMKIDDRQVVLSSGRVIRFSFANDAVTAPVVPAGPFAGQPKPGAQAPGDGSNLQSGMNALTIPGGTSSATSDLPRGLNRAIPPGFMSRPQQTETEPDAAPTPTHAPQLTPATINQLNSFFGGGSK